MSIEFTVDHDHTSIGDGGEEQLIGDISFTVQTRPGDFQLRIQSGSTPRTINLPRRTAYLGPDGHLYKDSTSGEPFRLPANDPIYNLDHITYRVDFSLTTLVGVPVPVRHTFFPAPSTDTTAYVTRFMADPEQIVMEVRTKAYAEDIIDLGTVGEAVVKSNTQLEARTALGIDLADLDEIKWSANFAAFPGVGVSDLIYGARDTGNLYRWNGTSYDWVSNKVLSTGITDSTSFGRSVVTGDNSAIKSGRLSLGTKLRGGNITVKPSGGSWSGLWSEWDWNNWIKPQVDRAIALGLNAIRLIGAPQAVLNAAASPSQITQATYDARWKQLADYTAQNNLRLYPALTEKWAFMGYTGAPNNFQDSTVTASIATTAGVLAAYSNVIGFDVFQEGSGSADGLVLADVLAMYSAIRAAAPGIPLTTSNSSGGYGSAALFWTDTSSLQHQIHTATGGSDFVDLHVYLDGVLPTDIDFHLAALGKPFLFGEFGDTQDQTSGAQTARYVAMAGLHNRAGIVGSFLWALADQGVTTATESGVWDNTGFAGPAFPAASTAPLSVASGRRTNMTNVLPTFNRTDTPVTPYRTPNDLNPVQARPLALVSGSVYGWAVGSNTSISAGSRGLLITATSTGATIAATSPTNGIPTLPSTPYVAEATFLAATTPRTVSLNIDWYDSSNAYISSSTTVAGIDSSSAPCTLTCVATSPSNAAYRVVICRITDTRQAASEVHYVNDVSTRPYSGVVGATSPPLLVKNLLYPTPVSTTAAAVPGVRYIHLVTGTTTFTLPTAVGNASEYVIINVDASLTTTIATTSAQTIAVTTLLPGQSVEVISDNANWKVTAAYKGLPAAHAATHELGGTDPIRLDQLALPTAAVAFNAQKATGLAAGTAATDAANVGQVPSGEIILGHAPAGALWTNIDRAVSVMGSTLAVLTSGIPRALLGSLAVAKTLTGLKFVTGTTAAVTPTNWWVCITDTAGNVLAVSADQTTTAIPASTVMTVPFTVPTLIPAGGFYAFIMVAAGTVPTLCGVSGLLNSPSIVPVFSGNSTTTGQTTPPAVAGSIGAPTAQSASHHWCWAY